MTAVSPPLRMRAWTQRQGPATDPYGSGGAWVDHLIGVGGEGEPCSWWTSTGQEQIDPQRSVSIATEHIRFGRGVDVQADDRIRRLVDERGRVVWDSTGGLVREVEHVAVRRAHLEATLRSTR